MATLTVGSGKQFGTISAAISAAQSGDTIQVQAGTYTNDTATINKSLTLQAAGGAVVLNETAAVPNDKGILVAHAGDIKIDGFVFQNASGPSGNDAGIRYEGGNLTLTNDTFRNNQNGLLATPVTAATGSISIDRCEFDRNGSGTGQTHNIYVSDVANFSIMNSYVHDANTGHEIKSRAEDNTVTSNRIYDNNSTSSYSVELPNGGNANLSGNTIEQGPNGQNSNIIGYGAEGNLHSGHTVNITSNTVVNDMNGRGTFVYNFTTSPVTVQNNDVYGLSSSQLATGPVNASGNTFTTTRPNLDTSSPVSYTSSPVSYSQDDTLVLHLSEDAHRGDAQFIAKLDGNGLGSPASVTASHSAGQDQTFTFDLGLLADGAHTIGVDFLNDAHGRTAQDNRNLYVNSVYVDGTQVGGATPLYTNAEVLFHFSVSNHHVTAG
jgi:Ca-dependent carbohydrate-binding module xylan-binding